MSIESQISPEGREKHACRLQRAGLKGAMFQYFKSCWRVAKLFQIEVGLENRNAEKRQVVKIDRMEMSANCLSVHTENNKIKVDIISGW